MGKQDTNLGTPPPQHSGHRERLRERFRNGGGDALADYELLELVLFRALPRRDTKPLAKSLIAEFGSFADVINADFERLRNIKGVGESVATELKLIRAAAERFSREDVIGRSVMSSWDAVVDHCRRTMAFEQKEQFRILFLDRKNAIIADEVQQTGTVDHTPVYPREVMKRALELSASGIILVHNHPSGDPTPSKADIAMTGQVVEAGQALGITVHDHLIVGRQGHVSLKAQGKM